MPGDFKPNKSRSDFNKKGPNNIEAQAIAEIAGRKAPRDKELEEAVLGALMLEKDAYTIVCDLLKPESFYEPENQVIYEAIQHLGASQQPIDMLTVTERLRLDGNLDKAGGALRITELTTRVTSAAHVEFHSRIISQKYLARERSRLLHA